MMKHIKNYKLFESNMDNFLDALTKELKPIGFDLEVVYDRYEAPDYKHG